MAFVSGKTNRKISNKEPTTYIPGIISDRGEAALRTQQVPVDARLHQMDNYREFLVTRRQLLSDRVNSFLRSVSKTVHT